MSRRKAIELTVGMPTYRDFHGVYFTIQALRMYHELAGVELVVVDNYGCQATRRFVEGLPEARYVLAPDLPSAAAAKDRVFQEAFTLTILPEKPDTDRANRFLIAARRRKANE